MTSTSVLDFDDVVREFRGGAGVHGITLRVDPGEIHALVGLNGAGKTTLLRLALGMLRAQRGGVRLFGEPVRTLSARHWAEVGAQIEYPIAYPELRARTNLELAARLHLLADSQLTTAVEAAIAELGLGAYADVRSRRLSLGNRQRLGLACALQHHPRLIVLDEPTNALDPEGIVLVRDALRRRADAGAGVLVSSHHLDEVARIADRITVVNDGRIVGTLDPSGVELERAFFAMIHPQAAA
jgi:ABC-2 type transport system ATP-binding protein